MVMGRRRRMRLKRLVVMGLDRLHVLHMRWLLVMVVVVQLWLEMGMLVRRRVMLLRLRLLLLLLLALLLRGVLLCTLGLWLRGDSTDPCLSGCLRSFLGRECSFALFDSAGHVSVCPATFHGRGHLLGLGHGFIIFRRLISILAIEGHERGWSTITAGLILWRSPDNLDLLRLLASILRCFGDKRISSRHCCNTAFHTISLAVVRVWCSDGLFVSNNRHTTCSVSPLLRRLLTYGGWTLFGFIAEALLSLGTEGI